MKKLTQLLRDGNDQAAETQPVTDEQIGCLAQALANMGHSPEFARSQPQDREIWSAVADAMDKQAADGAR